MHGSLLALVWLLQPSAAGASGSGASAPFASTAYATARPPECGVIEGGRIRNAWERAKEPNLRRYCDLLASGTSKVIGASSSILLKEVPQIADEADKLLPGHASPILLKGRALLRLGRPEEALAALGEAKRRDERALDNPIALLAWARANARTGHLAAAADAYRAALPRTSSLTSQERSAASFEAGMTVMAQGMAGIDDAIAMFRQARRDAQDAMQGAALTALALALDRVGQRDEARAILAERTRTDVKALLADPRVVEALADAGARQERDALVAIALEACATQPPGASACPVSHGADSAAAAKDAWRAYLDGAGGKGPWADHARERAGAGSSKKPVPPARGR